MTRITPSLRPIVAIALLALSCPAQAGRPPAGFAASAPPALPTAQANGSIFAAAGYAPLFTGARARGVGDMVTIILAESTSTSRTAATKTTRTGNGQITPPTAGPFVIDPNALNASASGSFNGQGNTAQTSSFVGTLAVTIAEVRPNGTALVRGEKRMKLVQGEEWLQFSGIVRLTDIDQTNSVLSSQVADAHINYGGNGTIMRSAREGWLSKFFTMISPF
ncbi:flagellar biosynthesis protein FlgH [Novosphingobium sp. FSY-8]|uniref:Flagellar L-ring protein n=1 Tax=Novosphingobium ovatum TaxID=1908523 RepID=A0ABW9XG18_9SPHN|nr:flagellar basal body L-ring protein FlgH [Novosphingobium ovatum]NBC37498.1 flagellar biosynthesis protein FlgH [Novosphingobium ovatum]